MQRPCGFIAGRLEIAPQTTIARKRRLVGECLCEIAKFRLGVAANGCSAGGAKVGENSVSEFIGAQVVQVVLGQVPGHGSARAHAQPQHEHHRLSFLEVGFTEFFAPGLSFDFFDKSVALGSNMSPVVIDG